MTINHKPWIGPRFEKEGFEGQRLLLFGFSHYGYYEDGGDNDDLTIYVMEKWALGGEIPFFNTLAGYFGSTDVRDFYSRVAFANTLPWSVGDEGEKFSVGGEDARAVAPDRVTRLIHDVNPDKAIVFTSKGWTLFPWYHDREEKVDSLLMVNGPNPLHYGGYRRKTGGFTPTFGLRHPMMAPWQQMRQAVAAIMAFQSP